MTPIQSTVPNSRVAATSAALTAAPQSGSAPVAGAPLLPDPPTRAVDVAAAIATLLIDSAFAQRKTAREAKGKAEGALEVAQKHELSEMRAAADQKYAAAKMEAWTQIATGAVTLGGMGLSAAGGIGTGNQTIGKVGSTIHTGMKDGGTDLAKGLGKLASSGQEHAADLSRESAKEAEQAASRMKSAIEACADDVHTTKESVRKALDFLKEYQAAQAQTQAAALHRA